MPYNLLPRSLLPGAQILNSRSEPLPKDTIPVPRLPRVDRENPNRIEYIQSHKDLDPSDQLELAILLKERENRLHSNRMRRNRNKGPVKAGPRQQMQIPRLPRKSPQARRAQMQLAQPGYPSLVETMANDSVSVAAPNPRSYLRRQPGATIGYRPNGECTITHREFVADVNGSVAFTAVSYAINPGLNGSFPWLSRMAANYESYRFSTLRYQFQTEASTSATGSLILAIDYDPVDTAPTSKTQVLSYASTVRSAPWTPCVHSSLAKDLRKRESYFVRAGSIGANNDIRLNDVGNLFVVTQGMAGATIIGELWVEYSVILSTPKTLSAGSGNSVWSHFTWNTQNTLGLQTGNLPATVVQGGAIGGTITETFTFSQPWQGLLSLDHEGTGLNMVNGSISGAAGVSAQIQTNAAGTLVTGYAVVNAQPGQTLVVNIPNTTITGGNEYFTQGTGAFS
jgi:hypothetical protein